METELSTEGTRSIFTQGQNINTINTLCSSPLPVMLQAHFECAISNKPSSELKQSEHYDIMEALLELTTIEFLAPTGALGMTMSSVCLFQVCLELSFSSL